MTKNGEPLRLYRKALRYVQDDPEVFLGTARRAAEAVLIDVAAQEQVGSRPTLEALLQTLTARHLLPPRIVLAVRTIQNYGNYGSHAQAGGDGEISSSEVQPCVTALTQLLAWYERFGSDAVEGSALSTLPGREAEPGVTRIADSTLVVVKAVLLGCGLEHFLLRYHHRLAHVPLPWADGLVAAVARRELDLAIYNENRVHRFRSSGDESAGEVVVLGRVGFSMGGRNFYMLAARDGRWGGHSAADFLARPHGAQVAVPRNSDMFDNVLLAFGTDEAGLSDLGVQVLDVPHHLGLEIFQLNRDVLAVGGQNLRMHALEDDRYVELLNFDVLDAPSRVYLKKASANVLIGNRSWLAALGAEPEEIHRELMRSFYTNWADRRRFDALAAELVDHAAFPADNDLESRERLVRHVLFETYRVGDP